MNFWKIPPFIGQHCVLLSHDWREKILGTTDSAAKTKMYSSKLASSYRKHLQLI